MNIRDLVRTEIENTAKQQVNDSDFELDTSKNEVLINDNASKEVTFAENLSLNVDEKKDEVEEPKIEFDVSDNELDLDLDLDLDVKTIDLGPIEEPYASENKVNIPKEEVKTILLDTKNSLNEEDLEKKQKLKEKKNAFNFFNDSVENENLELD